MTLINCIVDSIKGVVVCKISTYHCASLVVARYGYVRCQISDTIHWRHASNDYIIWIVYTGTEHITLNGPVSVLKFMEVVGCYFQKMTIVRSTA